MEPNEAHELIENHEHAEHDQSLRPVAFAMSILAVLVAITTLLGHRASTEAVLSQARASDQWNEYQAKRIRQHGATVAQDLLTATQGANSAASASLSAKYRKQIDQWGKELADESAAAREFENEVRRSEHKTDRFDLGEALLEIGLVITSIALLTRQRIYSLVGGAIGIAGVIASATAFLI